MSIHAIDRMVERYGILPSPAQADAAVLDIVEGRAVLCRKDKDAEVWRVRLAGLEVEVVYSPERAMIVTVLEPRKAWSKAQVKGRSSRLYIPTDAEARRHQRRLART